MSTCTRCGAEFSCTMKDGGADPCWCTAFPPVLPVPGVEASCWCPACLEQQVAAAAQDGKPTS